jgi:molybdenum cofactor cytidylyltransferase
LIAAIILAAGTSRRMAPANKLTLTDTTGTPMVARVADAVLASRARPVLAVLGHQAAELRTALHGRDLEFVHAPDYASGLSASLRAGLRALPAEAQAVVVCLGDMPLITAALIDALIDAYDPAAGHLIVVPTHEGQRGNPVLWHRSFFAEMEALTGDHGARPLMRHHAAQVLELPTASAAILTDFDTHASLSDPAW